VKVFAFDDSEPFGLLQLDGRTENFPVKRNPSADVESFVLMESISFRRIHWERKTETRQPRHAGIGHMSMEKWQVSNGKEF
jgi:hypothetical protein